MRSVLSTTIVAILAAIAAPAQTPNPSGPAPVLPSTDPGAPDPFAWLEDIHSKRAMDWVAAENARTAARLETDPRYETGLEET